MDRLLSEKAVIDALRDYLVGKRCFDDGTLACRLIENEVINKLPSAEPHLVNGSQGLVKELVNKDDALRSIEQYVDKFDCIDVNFLDGLKTAMQLIRELPSAEPERKTGKWINGKCNRCGEHAPFWAMASTYHCSNFCPNCGCKMEVDT